MRILIILIAFSALFISSCTERKAECDCPENKYTDSKRDTLFHLSDGETIALCGHQLEGAGASVYSEFILARCADDVIIDFWDATQFCRLEAVNDTLLVEELGYFAVGDSLKVREEVWTTEKLFVQDNHVSRKLEVNRQLASYNANEIQQVLTEYETSDSELTDEKMDLLNRLFIAAISGSAEARNYFIGFKDKFQVPDGANSQQYRDLSDMLALWDSKT